MAYPQDAAGSALGCMSGATLFSKSSHEDLVLAFFAANAAMTAPRQPFCSGPAEIQWEFRRSTSSPRSVRIFLVFENNG